MTGQVDKNEELSDRFSTRSKPKKNTDSTDDAKDTDDEGETDDVKDTEDTSHTDNTGGKENTGDTGGMGGTGHTGDTDDQGVVEDPQDTGDTGHAGHTDNTGSTRNRTQYVMYLPDDLQKELNDLYDQYNGQSLINGNGGIEKHKDFLEGLVRAGLNNDDLDEYIGVKDQSK